MQTSRKRLYFKCPVCGHTRRYALLVTEEGARNRYLCEKCGAIATPKNYLIANVIYGALTGLATGLLAYWFFTQYLSESPPVFAILSAAPFAIILSWLIGPAYSRIAYRWTKAHDGQ